MRLISILCLLIYGISGSFFIVSLFTVKDGFWFWICFIHYLLSLIVFKYYNPYGKKSTTSQGEQILHEPKKPL